MHYLKTFAIYVVGVIASVAIANANPVNLIANGGFEQGGGSLSFWTVTNWDSNAGGSWYVQTGTGSPTNGFPVSAPPEGTHAAMTDDAGPSSQALTQSFTVPVNPGTLNLSFQYFYSFGDFNGYFPWDSSYTPPSTLDYNYFSNTGNLNDQAVVNILTAGAGALDASGPTVVTNILQLDPLSLGDPNSNPCFPAIQTMSCSSYLSMSVPLTDLVAGQNYQLQFAEVDDQGTFNFGVDDVSIDYSPSSPAVPEPRYLGFLVVAGVALALADAARRKRWRRCPT
jgi:hypothetical protein